MCPSMEATHIQDETLRGKMADLIFNYTQALDLGLGLGFLREGMWCT
jgi:hypothetical protein